MTSFSSTPASVWIALGGNVGDVAATFADALKKLDQSDKIDVKWISSLHRTAPVGEQAGTPFTNAVARLETLLPPLELLDELQGVETQQGRVRSVRWGPRTLDLDLLMYGDKVIDHPRLQVPHPACWYRRFVLDPWVEIGAEVVHPIKRLTIRELRNRLLVRPMSITLIGEEREHREELVRRLTSEFPEIHWPSVIDLDCEPTLSIGLGSTGWDTEAYEGLRQTFFVSWLELKTPITSEVEAIREIVHSANP